MSCIYIIAAELCVADVSLSKPIYTDVEEHISSSYAQIQSARSGSFVFSSVCHPGITRPAITIQDSPFGAVYLHTKHVP